MTTLTQARLKEVINYCPSSGAFTRISFTRSNRQYFVNTPIPETNITTGYYKTTIDSKVYALHRLAVLYMEGYMPEATVDHINRNIRDNRYSNLRIESQVCQLRNRRTPKNNSSGIKGIYWCLRKSRWRVEVGFKGRSRFVGLFKDLGEAACCRLAAEQCLGFADCDQSSSASVFVKQVVMGGCRENS